MGDITDDELLAKAIADVAYDVLDRLRGAPEDRHRFLIGFLRLAAVYGATPPEGVYLD